MYVAVFSPCVMIPATPRLSISASAGPATVGTMNTWLTPAAAKASATYRLPFVVVLPVVVEATLVPHRCRDRLSPRPGRAPHPRSRYRTLFKSTLLRGAGWVKVVQREAPRRTLAPPHAERSVAACPSTSVPW